MPDKQCISTVCSWMSKKSSLLLLGRTGSTKISERELGPIQASGDGRHEKVEDEGGRASGDTRNEEHFNQEFRQILCVLLLI